MDLKDYRSSADFLHDLPELALTFREKLKTKDETFAFSLDGGPMQYIELKDGLLSLTGKAASVPVCTVEARDKTLMDLLAGRTSPLKALLFGGVRVRGDKGELLRLLSVLGG